MASGELDTNLALLVVSLCTASALSLGSANVTNFDVIYSSLK
jgi:hypothetical protein